MTARLSGIGRDWAIGRTQEWIEKIERVLPTEYNEQHRYLPASVTPIPGYIRYEVNPFMREILDCAAVDSPVREVNIKKGVQVTYTTLLESIILYYAVHVATTPMAYITADNELAKGRIEGSIIPMLNSAGFGDRIQSADEGNNRKTGKTAKLIQFRGGAYLLPMGATNADKYRQWAIQVMLKDEIDAWPLIVGRDGDPDGLSDDRCAAYWPVRKIYRGGTPKIKGVSKIEKQFQRGDCRYYLVLCKACSYPQKLWWDRFAWDLDSDGLLVNESVRYLCEDCKQEHFDADKEKLFALEHGAYWKPSKRPDVPNVRSYHLPALYSPPGMQPWHKAAALYLEAWDPENKRVKDVGKYQVFYNNVLAEPFELFSGKVSFVQASAHRRTEYALGTVPNKHARAHAGGPIEILLCAVDVHKGFLAVGVFGFTRGMQTYLVDYQYLSDEDCSRVDSPVWPQLREILEEKIYRSDDGLDYRVTQTFVDSGWENALVCDFCSEYEAGVYPIVGRDRPGKYQTIKEFKHFETQANTIGYAINVDYYKDRIATALRREWAPEAGQQKTYQFNTPVDTTDKMLKELTVERVGHKIDATTGRTTKVWHRPQGARNELWDLLVYVHASIEVLMRDVCVNTFEQETVDREFFWGWVVKEQPYRG